MQDVTVVRHLYTLAKKVTVKYHSLRKYNLCVDSVEGCDINFLNLKREDIVCKKGSA